MTLATQTTEELHARRLRALAQLERLNQRVEREKEIVDWLVEEIDNELKERSNVRPT